MNPLKLNRMTLSPAIWQAIAPNGMREYFDAADTGSLIKQADYQTGTLNEADAAELRTIADYFRPVIIAEVGTYIGRSTRALAKGMRKGEIYTCDVSNDINIGDTYGVRIEQYPRKTSTQMFQDLLKREIKPDLFYIDGRLGDDDPGLMAQLNPDAVIVLDDFEGVEKGTFNAAVLLATEFTQSLLVYPRAGGKTALLVPYKMLQFVPQ
jgi:hypothetical protein